MATLKPVTLDAEAGLDGGAFVVRLHYENLAGPEGGVRGSFWWRVPDGSDLRDPPILDSLVTPLALYAQMFGQDVRVRGPMSRLGLFNLARLLEARRGTQPERFPRLIAVDPDSVEDPVPAEGAVGRAALAFSGGLDSTFTAVRHTLGLRGEAAYRLDALVMAHGLDAPLSDAAGFDGMLRRAEPVSRRVGVQIRPVVTDAMRFGRLLWPQQATPLVASCMSLFMHRLSTGIIGGGIPYSAGRVGLGHPPIFDQYCSNALFRVTTDGAELGRTAKIEQLLAFPDLLSGIKVCIGSMGGGGDSGLNCGRCWKCLITYMNFRAAGVETPGCFDRPIDESLISEIPAPTLYAARELGMTWEDVAQRGSTGPWVDRLRRVIARVPPDKFVFGRARGPLRSTLRKVRNRLRRPPR